MMLQGSVVIAVALAYLAMLFAVASYGDRVKPGWMTGAGRPTIYALSLGVYCTSWTFFGAVGLASRSGFDFLTIYIGPLIMIGFCHPLVLRVVRLAKDQNITSIADFVAARYGKSQPVAAIVTVAAIIGAVPYIALQLKAVSSSLATILSPVSLHAERAGVRRPRLLRRAGARRLRHRLRYPPRRRHRASGGPDARDRDGIGGQARRLPGGRPLRHLRPVRRLRRAARGGRARAASPPPSWRRAPTSAPGRRWRSCPSAPPSCCRASSTSPSSRTPRSASCAAPPGCSRPISC